MKIKWLIIVSLSIFCCLLLCVSLSFSASDEVISCEVLEVSGIVKSTSSPLKEIRYILFHHANSRDRVRLSEGLKAHSGEEVVFRVNGKEFKGILFRMPHCFGRGLIIHMHDLKVKKRDIIEVILPFPEAQK